MITHGELFRLLVWCLANTNPHYACLNSGSEFTRRSRGGAGTLASLPLLSQKWNIWQLKLVIIRGTKRSWRRVQLTMISLFESDCSQVHCVCRVCFILGGKKNKKNLLNEKSWLQIAAHISVLCWWDFIVQLLKAEGGGILMKENLYVGFIPTGCVTETLPNPPDDLAIAAEILQDITQLVVCSVAMATGRQPEAGHPSASVRRRCWRDGCFQLTSARDSFDWMICVLEQFGSPKRIFLNASGLNIFVWLYDLTSVNFFSFFFA